MKNAVSLLNWNTKEINMNYQHRIIFKTTEYLPIALLSFSTKNISITLHQLPYRHKGSDLQGGIQYALSRHFQYRFNFTVFFF